MSSRLDHSSAASSDGPLPVMAPPRSGPQRGAAATRKASAQLLVEQRRGELVESRHRGHVVEVDTSGTIVRLVGDPTTRIALRSLGKPFGLIALIEAGGIEAFGLSTAELAVMAGSHAGEDVHVRTLQAVLRRAGVHQSTLECGTRGMPRDAVTAERIARDGEQPGPIRHTCSGQHIAILLLGKLQGWRPEEYWADAHPIQLAIRSVMGRALARTPEVLQVAPSGCGLPTCVVTLRDAARLLALLADPASIPLDDSRRTLAAALSQIRDAMLAQPEMLGSTKEGVDEAAMRAAPGRLVSLAAPEGVRGVAILAGSRQPGVATGASGLIVKVEDGDGLRRAGDATVVEALRQAGVLEPSALRALARYHRPVDTDPHGRLVAEAVARFELAPVGELIV